MKIGINEVKIMAYEWAPLPSQTHEKAPQSRFLVLYSVLIPAFLLIFAIILETSILDGVPNSFSAISSGVNESIHQNL